MTGKLSVLIMLVALVSLSHLAQQPDVGRYTLPDRDRTVQYIDNLIDSYNLLVNEYDKPRQDFNSIKAHFSLYHEVGNSFKVIVVETTPSFAPYIQYLSLIFVSFRADQPSVIMDYNDTLGSLFPATDIVNGDWYILRNIPFTYNDTAIRQDFIFTIDEKDILGDYVTTSNNAAQYIYQQDEKQIQIPRVSQTQTVTQTSISIISQATGVQPNPNPINYIIYIILGAIGIGGFIVVTYFGSLKDALDFVVDAKERKRELEKIRKLFRLLLGRNKRTNEQKVSEIKRPMPQSAKSRLPSNADAIITLLNPFLVRWQAKEILGMKPSRWLEVDTEDRIDLQKSARSLSDKLLQLEASYHDVWDGGLINQIQIISEELRKFGIAQPFMGQNDLDFTQLELHGRAAFEDARAIVGWLKQMNNEP